MGEQLLHTFKTGLQQSGTGHIKHLADVIVGGNLLDPEQRLAVGTALAFLQPALKGQKRRALQEKHGKGRQPKISPANIAATTLPGARKGGTNAFHPGKKGCRQLHPHSRISFLLIWESSKFQKSQKFAPFRIAGPDESWH